MANGFLPDSEERISDIFRQGGGVIVEVAYSVDDSTKPGTRLKFWMTSGEAVVVGNTYRFVTYISELVEER